MTTDPASAALQLADRVFAAFAARGVRAVLIGAAALAVHGYPRSTQDLDLGVVAVPLDVLRAIADELRAEGYRVEVREPDLHDPLGGLLRVAASEELEVDVINFVNPHTGAGRRLAEAAFAGPSVSLAQHRVPVIGVEPLVLLKLAAGSRFDLRDVAELLAIHPEIDRDALRDRCRDLRLDKKLARVLADLAEDEALEGGDPVE